MACGSCGGYRSGSRRASATSWTTVIVVTGDGDCALLTEQGQCRVFASPQAAAAAAAGLPDGWTLRPVTL